MTTYILFLSTQTFILRMKNYFFSFWNKSPSHNQMSESTELGRLQGDNSLKITQGACLFNQRALVG